MILGVIYKKDSVPGPGYYHSETNSMSYKNLQFMSDK